MTRKVIQVPVDEELLNELDETSKKLHESRSELIRRACRDYLKQLEDEEMDRLYRQGYEKTPEKPEVGEAQAAMAGETLPEEAW